MYDIQISTKQGWCQSGPEGAEPPVGEPSPPCLGIFTDEHIYVLYELWAVVIDLFQKDNRLFSLCQI